MPARAPGVSLRHSDTRIWLIAGAALLVTLALAAGIVLEERRLTGGEQLLVRTARNDGRNLAGLLAAELKGGCSRLAEAASEDRFERKAVKALAASPEISYLYVLNTHGEIVWSSNERTLGSLWRGGTPKDFLSEVDQRARVPELGDPSDADVFVEMVAAAGTTPRCGAVVVGLSEQGLARRLRSGTSRILASLAGILFSILIAVGGASLALSHRRGEEIRRSAQAEHLAELGLLAAGLAHELRNPLNAIHFASDSLALRARQLETSSSKEMVEITQEITDEIGELDRIVRSFLSYARQSRDVPEDLDVTAIVRSALQIARPELARSEADVKLEVPADPVEAHLPAGPLRQVLINLIQNAAQACSLGRTITLRVTAAEQSVRVEIEDDGPGVPVELRRTLFQPFATGRKEGTGLGLAICRRLVTAMEGTIRLEPVEPRGSRFVLELRRFLERPA
ncbi:MAG TPA: HAMP domain-containing sensor histidine kinase [Thermoanaerobaculia bacterium]|nr:HAMP domain-containing sensor histidine kinase [Thermoanaerobaculia bacterium]